MLLRLVSNSWLKLSYSLLPPSSWDYRHTSFHLALTIISPQFSVLVLLLRDSIEDTEKYKISLLSRHLKRDHVKGCAKNFKTLLNGQYYGLCFLIVFLFHHQ